MQSLEDNLEPLHQGIWEVVVPKDQVTMPIGDHWVRAHMYIPSPGTIASYRYGQYHLHEKETEYRVHLDRYDPEKHPILHLVDDAPLILMIIDTIAALAYESGRAMHHTTGSVLQTQSKAWRSIVIMGIFMLFFGLWIAIDPILAYGGIIRIIIPAILIFLALSMLANAIRIHPVGIRSIGTCILGIGIGILGISTLFDEPLWLISLFPFILGVWTCGSALISLHRSLRGRRYVPEGFELRLAIGILSLLLALLLFMAPEAAMTILMYILVMIASLLGVYLLAEGLTLRSRMKNPPVSGMDQEGVPDRG